jgi:hypothetical protein
MTALAKDRNTARAEGDVFSYGVKGATKIFAGSLVMLDASGRAVPGATATGQVAAGRAEEQVDNTGADNALSITVRGGTFRWANSASTDLIAATEIGDDCYIVDDQTVAKTTASSTRSIAGKVVAVDAIGVWVRTII